MIELIQKLIKPGPAVKLASQLEGLIRDGKVLPEALLPPVREVARALGVSPGTAAAAYKALRLQGVISTDGRRGTRVLARPSRREYGETPAPPHAIDLQVANPDPDLLPDLRGVFARLRDGRVGYGGSHLDPGLVAWARNDLAADDIDGEHLVVTSGAIAAIHRALRCCLSPGDKVAVEDPGFNEHHSSVLSHGMALSPVAIDDEGMLPASLQAALAGGAKAVIFSPRFQSPTGAALSKGRAAALSAVLAGFPDVAILVDDYASLICGSPYHDLIGPRRARWMVTRSFNKPVAPDLRVGIAAADAETADRLRREQWCADGWVSGFLQEAAAAAVKSRSISALIERARGTYQERRETLLRELADRGVRAHGASGLNVWIPVTDEAAAARALLDRSWCVRAGARYRLRSGPAIRVTIAKLQGKQAARLADDVAAVLGTDGNGRAP